MENSLEIRGLCKKYEGFSLNDISFSLPRGCVMGFIGENGAGKTTTIKAILNLIRADSGSVSVLGLDAKTHENEIKQRLGVVLEDSSFPAFFRATDVGRVLKNAYPAWEDAQFADYLRRFKIDPAKKIADYSKGMKMKLSIATALSHHAELLLLDEPTSGLDPIVRGEVLDLFWEFLQDDTHAVLLSSHITSDLDKIADYITFIHEGRLLLSQPRDELLATYGLLRGSREQLAALDARAVASVRHSEFGAEALVRRSLLHTNAAVEPVNLEQIMLFLTGGDAQ